MPALNSQQPPGSPVPARSIPPPASLRRPGPGNCPRRKAAPAPRTGPPECSSRSLRSPWNGRCRAPERERAKRTETKESAPGTPSPGRPAAPAPLSALPVIRPRAALQPSHAPLSPGPFLPSLSPVSLPASPAPRSPDSPKPRALPGSPQALPRPAHSPDHLPSPAARQAAHSTCSSPLTPPE